MKLEACETAAAVARRHRPNPCPACATAAGCDKHKRFTCATCGQLTGWSQGAADDRPNDCTACWAVWFDAMCALATGLLGWLP